MKFKFMAKIVSCWSLLVFLCSSCCASEINWPETIKQSVAGITSGSKIEDVYVGLGALKKAGDEAIFELLKEVDNHQVASNYLQEAKVKRDPITGEVTGKYMTEVGDVVFGIIQDKIEGEWPLDYIFFRVTDRDNIKEWLQSRSGKSLKEMRVELALAALEKVKKRYSDSSSSRGQEIIRIFENRIDKIKNNESPDLVAYNQK